MEKAEEKNINRENEADQNNNIQPEDELEVEKNVSEEENQFDETETDGEIEVSKQELIDEINKKDTKIDALNKEVDDLLNRLQRLQADFINYRKRSEKEKREMTLKGKIELCENLLPVIDNFERALNSADQEGDFFNGVEMIYRQIITVLNKEGIEEISALGEEFNPEFHEAIMKVEADDQEEGTVVEVLQKGYIVEGRVIRPAMVKVAC
ncbi:MULTISPECIES: nucleotide exchange factor GrpE [unclassified Halanaerobium]|uniref:nucleotide exchange factor GrpE n=1 Tax=unclassified Halanaerobium TaxID=2641197 RepID=UPI000DF23FC8|nr:MULTISPECIES: nucleotide exchange factor GrpE [unclassified Halanaerobium]RCW45402.1 molecular chaperone GrpE [Halanaerobium sp. MA284_MarDTE_T2]RCW82580.1 molecular chaperone GrpE [Halanaerobium sp. DL-01]